MKKRFLSLLLCIFLLLSLAACTQGPDRAGVTSDPVQTLQRPTGKELVVSGVSRYQVVIERNDTLIGRAAEQMVDLLGVDDFVFPKDAGDGNTIRLCLEEKDHPMDYSIFTEGDSIVISAGHSGSLCLAVKDFIAAVTEYENTLYYVGGTVTYSYMAEHGTPYGIVGYDFLYDAPGYAGGDVFLYGERDAEYTLWWGDDEGKLAAHSHLITQSGEANTISRMTVQSFTAIPEGATRLLATDGSSNVVYTYSLPEERRFTGEKLYSFGAISDSHMGTRYGSSVIPYDHFVYAVKVFQKKNCSLVGICGDISYDNILSEYQLHEKAIKECYTFAPDLPIYTVAGNHESKYTGFSREWFLRYTRNVVAYQTELLPEFTPDNDLDFVIELPDGSVMIYLNQVYYDYGKTNSRLLTDAQLDWLGERLEEYRDRTVFLFFHTFLDEEVGDGTSIGGGEYSLPLISTTEDHKRLTEYLSKYKNVVYFSGHSHQSFDTMFLSPKPGKTNYDVNIDNKDGSFATMVHIPSVAAPRVLSEKNSSQINATDRSEGYIVHVYEDCIVLEGYDFVGEETISYANYIIEKAGE